MHANSVKIAAVICALLAPGLTVSSWAAVGMRGSAEVGYVKYDAEVDGREVVSGTTFAQKYNLTWNATNLVSRMQQNYYSAKLGYDWMSFDTTASGQYREFDIKESYGKLSYAADVGFVPATLPIRVRAYINDDQPPRFEYNLNSYANLSDYTLINDGLIYNIDGKGKTVASGITFEFSPKTSRNSTLRALPDLYVDYRQTSYENFEDFNRIDYKTRDLVVSLSQYDNWLNYRKSDSENLLDSADNYTRQQLQIGQVDFVGRRKWVQLTNWIEVSADGQLTKIDSLSRDKAYEEYDVNLMAIASRKSWRASSFMNYNRNVDDTSQTEKARLPVYVKGIYGADTDWYVSLAALRERQKLFSQNSFSTTDTNSITAGGTTFKRSSFTLSPSVSLQTRKDSYGVDSYAFAANLETASTSRFSDKLGLAGKLTYRATDDGGDRADSKSWSTLMDFRSSYAPTSSLRYRLQETLEMGSGSGYLQGGNLLYGSAASDRVGTYQRNYLDVSSSWVPSAQFSVMVGGSYEYLRATDLRPAHNTYLYFQTSYNVDNTYYRFDTKYQRNQNGYDTAREQWLTSAEVLYRPNRYHDGLFRLAHEKEYYANNDKTRVELLQRYTYNLFTRTGLLRNIATLTEEYGYNSDESYGIKGSTQYLMFAGRYNPTERLTLYGSVKYETSDPGSVVMFYNAGMSADFRLLTTSLDYSYARRESDDRIEKRLTAHVKRAF